MKRAIATCLLVGMLGVGSATAQEPKRVSAAQGNTLRQTYAGRVKSIYGDVKPVLTSLMMSFQEMQDVTGNLQKRQTLRDAMRGMPNDPDYKRLKASLLSDAAKARINLKRLRAISPVPRSFKRADDDLIEGTLTLDQSLDTLLDWIDSPLHELELRANRQLRSGISDLDRASQKIARLTEPALRSKVYVDD